MSQNESHFGKLRKVQLPTNWNLEDWCRAKCETVGIIEISSYNDSWEEQFRDHFHEKYFISNGTVWEVFDHIESEDGYADIMIPNEDGTITFFMEFYNGGTCLSEMIEEGLERLKKKQDEN